jgi:O-antigen/teichoic acid export membrane protein
VIARIKQLLNTANTHAGFKLYFANTSWMFGEQILRMISGLLVGIWVARYLGPEQFGVFSYAIAFVSIFGSIAKLGLDGIVVRDLVNEPHKRDVYLGTAFWLKLVGAFITLFLVAFATLFTSNNATTNLYIFIIAGGLVFQSFEVVDFYFQSKVLSKFVSLSKITQLLVSSLLKIYFVLTGADLLWFVVVSIVDQLTLAMALAYAYSKQNSDTFCFKFDKVIAKDMLLNAKPLIISSIMVSIYSSIDRVIIKETLGVREVGLYTVATGLTTTLYFIPILISNSLFPAILNAKKQSEDAYNRRLSQLYKYMLLVGLLICLVVSAFSTLIIHVLYGNQYADAASVLQIYIWIFLVICFSSIFGKWLLSENLQYLMLRFTFMAIVINILGCLFFIPLWTIKGAAFAALASQLIPFVWFGMSNKEIRSQIKCAFRML